MTLSDPERAPYADWLGRTEHAHDTMAPEPAQGAAALLDLDAAAFDAGAALPPLWHWFYFLSRAPQAQLGSDGHAQRGAFLPPITLPRRMFAGARTTFHHPLTLGVAAEREATVVDVREKQGRTGALAFVTVRHRLWQRGRLCVEEEQDIVYREPGAALPAPTARERPALPAGAWSRELVPDSRLLFRFSALTFNAHRIHYDRAYAATQEGYPGLVVHGQLVAVLLADLVARHQARPIARFTFKGLAPLLDLGSVRLAGVADGDRAQLMAHGVDGTLTMEAEAELG